MFMVDNGVDNGYVEVTVCERYPLLFSTFQKRSAILRCLRGIGLILYIVSDNSGGTIYG